MLRPVWTGSISFGLVGIPVKAAPVQSSHDLRFELLHKKCHGKTSIKRYCPQCQAEVTDEELVRAYQYAKGRYVYFEPGELSGRATPAKHTLQIVDFVDIDQVDPIYFEKPYYLFPAQGGERTYALLHRAMRDKGRVGIGKVALRDREYLALGRPTDLALVLELLSFPDEVRLLEDPIVPLNASVEPRELEMAHMLIDSMTADFHPEKYRDDYRVALDELIQGKVEGGATTARPSAPARKPEVIDLMERLRQSIEKQKSDRSAGAPQEVRISQPPEEPAARHRPRPRSGHLDLGESEKIQAPAPALAAQRKSKSRTTAKEGADKEAKAETPARPTPRGIGSRGKNSAS